jgi:hypothetical protein
LTSRRWKFDMLPAMALNRWKSNGWTVCGVALLSFAAGMLVTARANSDRVFELRIYHATPGKVEALETRFRNEASKLLAKHGLVAVGYWVPDDAPASDDTFIYLLVHPNRAAATEMFADPAFQSMMKEEQTDKLVQKVDDIYMHPSDFSATK